MEFVPPLRNVGLRDKLGVPAAVRLLAAGGVLGRFGFGEVPSDSGQRKGDSNTSTSAAGVTDETIEVRGS